MLFVLIWSIVGRIAEKLNSASVSSPKPGDAFKGIQRNSVTEAMLPGKYSRKPITQVEMDAVEVRCIYIKKNFKLQCVYFQLGGAHL